MSRLLPVVLAAFLVAAWFFYPTWQSWRRSAPPIRPVASGPLFDKLPAYGKTGLPEGAILRLGATNYQHENIIFLHRIRYSPDGLWLVCTDSSEFFIWSLRSGQRVRRFKGGTMHSPFDFSPDSRLLACCAEEVETPAGVDPGTVAGKRAVSLFDLQGGGKRLCEDSDRWYRDLRFSPDGTRLLGSDGGTIYVWEVATGHLLERITDRNIGEGIFTADTRFLIWSHGAQAGKAVPIHVWSLADRREVALLPGHESGFVVAQTVSPDGRLLVTAGSAGGIRLWSLETFTMVHELERTEPGGNYPNTALAFSPDGQQLVTARVHHPWRLWDCATGKELAAWPSNCFPNSAAFSPDGSTIAYISDGKRVCFRDVLVGQDQAAPVSHTGEITDCLVTPDGTTVVSAGSDGKIISWSLEDGRPVRVLRHEGRSAYALSPGIEGNSVFAAGDGFLDCLDLATGAVRLSFPIRGMACFDLDVSTATGRLVADMADRSRLPMGRTARVFDGRTGATLGSYTTSETMLGAEHPRFLPGADRIVVGMGPAPAIVDYRTGKIEKTHVFGGERFLSALRCSGDGRFVAAADCLGKLIIWDRVTDRETRRVEAMSPEHHGLAFSPDGGLLAVGLRENARVPATIRLFQPATGQQVATFSPDVGRIMCLAFNPTGDRLISGSGDGSLVVWDVRKYHP